MYNSKHFLVPMVLMTGSFLALAGAFISEYVFGYAPCKLCVYQRIPYFMVIILAAIAILLRFHEKIVPWLLIGCCALLFIDGGIATYHAGIEWGLFEGPGTCTDAGTANTIDELKQQVLGADIVPCDQATFMFLGLSMAAWNMLYAFGLFFLSYFLIKRELS